MDASILYDAHATMRSATLGGAPRSSSLPLTTTETSSGQPEDYVPHFEPSSTRATVLAEIIKSCKLRGVARDLVMNPGATPTTATGPPASMIMSGLVRHNRTENVPVEFLVHDIRKSLIKFQTDKSSLFPSGRLALGVYGNGEQLAVAPDSVLRSLATRLDIPHIGAHLPPPDAPGAAEETKSNSDFDVTTLVGTGVAAPATTAAVAPAMPEGLRRVAAYATVDQVLAYLDPLGRDALEPMFALDWGFAVVHGDLAAQQPAKLRIALQHIIADARAVYMARMAAVPVVAPADPTRAAVTTSTSHDGGEDITLYLAETRRKAPKAPWLAPGEDGTVPEAMTLSSLPPGGIAAVRAVLTQDVTLQRIICTAVADFTKRHPGHPLVAELTSAIKGSDDDRWDRAVTKYMPGAFDKAFCTAPIGVLTAWAAVYCFTASKGGDRADLLVSISDFRIVTFRGIASFDALAIVLSNSRTAATDLGVDPLTLKELATSLLKAADGSPPAWRATPEAAPFLKAMNEFDQILDDNEAPTDEAYQSIIESVASARKLAVRARSRLPPSVTAATPVPELDGKILKLDDGRLVRLIEVSDTAGASGGAAGSSGRDRGRERGDRQAADRDQSGGDRGRDRDGDRSRGRGGDRTRGQDTDAERGRDAATSEKANTKRYCISFHLGHSGCNSKGRRCRFVHGDATKDMPDDAFADAVKMMSNFKSGFKLHKSAVTQYGIHGGMLNAAMLSANPDVPPAPAEKSVNLIDDAAVGGAEETDVPSLRSILEEHSLSDSVFMIRGESADELDFDGTLGFDGAPGSDGPVLTRSADSYNTASSAAAFTELCDLYDSVLESYSDFRSPVGN